MPCVLLVVALASCFAASASAQEATVDEDAAHAERVEEGRLLFLAAQRAFDDGRYPDALASFERSYELAEDPQILYNIAITLDRLRRDEETLEAFRMYLQLVPGTPDRRDIEARIRVLEDQIARGNASTDVTPPNEDGTGAGVEAQIALGTGTDPVGTEPPDDDYYVLEQWWFWTALVAVVAGGVAAAVIVSSQSPSPEPGSEGIVIEALRW